MSEHESLLSEIARSKAQGWFSRDQNRINELIAASLSGLNARIQSVESCRERLERMEAWVERLDRMEASIDRLDRNLAALQAANRKSEVDMADFEQQFAKEKSEIEQERVVVTELRDALTDLLRDEPAVRNASGRATAETVI